MYSAMDLWRGAEFLEAWKTSKVNPMPNTTKLATNPAITIIVDQMILQQSSLLTNEDKYS
jgi:hypothetical protein